MKKKHILSLLAFAAIITGFIYFGSNVTAQKSDVPNKSPQAAPLNTTPQTLPFSQDWTNAGLITVANDWSLVPGIVGYQGIDIVTATGVDARTILAPDPETAPNVFANQTAPDTFASGGVAEFDALTNPSIALNGSGTADVPHIILYLNTTGQNNIRVSYIARDLDASVDNAIQQINTQYRVGTTGNFINVPGGYIADATSMGTATQATPVSVTLPAAASNQALVEVRIMSTNAVGNDEWVGIDDILVNTAATPARSTATVDFNGDGRTDWAVTRQIASQRRWFYNTNGTGAPGVILDWGLTNDRNVPEDYDGDGKDDIAVWRPVATGQPSGNAFFYILQSATNTIRIDDFGQTGDDPSVVGDYDGDRKADAAVYRGAAQSIWFYRGTLNNPSGGITFVPWGTTIADRPAPGDYDGDGKYDFVIRRNDGGSGRYWMNQTTAGVATQIFGLSSDFIVPGDYDGDGKTDLAVKRNESGIFSWYIQPSSGGAIQQFLFGAVASDLTAQGDYDGDGKTDVAIWRDNDGTFWARNSSSGAAQIFQLGLSADTPVANYNTH